MGKGVALVLLLAGCAYSPADLRESGLRREFASAKPPREVAHCIVRGVENFKPMGWMSAPIPAQLREGVAPGSFEVVAQHPGAGFGFLMIAEVAPNESGSNTTIWLSPDWPHDDMPERVVEPCGARRVSP